MILWYYIYSAQHMVLRQSYAAWTCTRTCIHIAVNIWGVMGTISLDEISGYIWKIRLNMSRSIRQTICTVAVARYRCREGTGRPTETLLQTLLKSSYRTSSFLPYNFVEELKSQGDPRGFSMTVISGGWNHFASRCARCWACGRSCNRWPTFTLAGGGLADIAGNSCLSDL